MWKPGVIAALILTALPHFSQSFSADSFFAPESDVTTGRIDARYEELHAEVRELFPFPEGSGGDAELRELLCATLEDTDARVRRYSFDSLPDAHSFSEVITAEYAHSPAHDSGEDGGLLLAIPIDHPRTSSIDRAGTAGIALGLVIAELWDEIAPGTALTIAFLGAERGTDVAAGVAAGGAPAPFPDFRSRSTGRRPEAWLREPDPPDAPDSPRPPSGAVSSEPEHPLGSRWLRSEYERRQASLPNAVIYLDLDALAPAPAVETGAPRQIAPRRLVSATYDGLSAVGLSPRPRDGQAHLYRLGVGGTSTSRLVGGFLSRGIAATAISAEASEAQVAPYRYVRAIRDTIVRLEGSRFESWDQNYLAMSTPRLNPEQLRTSRASWRLELAEPEYVIALLTVLGLGLAYAAFARKRVAKYLRAVVQNLLSLPALILTMFLVIAVSGRIVAWYLDFLEFPQLWLYLPLPTFLLKAALAGLLFYALYLLVGRIPLPKNGSFYSACALLFFVINVFIFAAFNLALAGYATLAFVFALLFAVTRYRRLKLLWILGAAAGPIYLAAIVFLTETYEVIEPLLFSPVAGNLLLTFVALPYVLMLIRVNFLIPHPIRGKRAFTLKTAVTILAMAAVTLTAMIGLYRPHTPESPQPVRVIEHSRPGASVSTLELAGTAPLGTWTLDVDGLQIGVDADAPYDRFPISAPSPPLEIDVDTSVFLRRRTIGMRIATELPLETLSITFRSETPFIHHSASFPAQAGPDGRSVTLHIGRNPPTPLDVSFTAPKHVELTAEIQATFRSTSRRVFTPDPSITLYPELRYRHLLEIETEENQEDHEEDAGRPDPPRLR